MPGSDSPAGECGRGLSDANQVLATSSRQCKVAFLLRRVYDTNSLRLQARQIDSELVQLGVERGTVSPKCALSDPRGRQGLPLWRVTGRRFIV